MKTFQDLQALGNDESARMRFVEDAVREHKATADYSIAVDANAYDKKQNATIKKYQKLLYTLSGQAVPDNFSANHKIVSGFFPRFVTQQNQYLLGNGVKLEKDENKKKLGASFDVDLQRACRIALVEKVAFCFWNYDHMMAFRFTEFVPLWDEEDGSLKAGIRFWQIDTDKPIRYTLYEMDGYTEYIKKADEQIEVRQKKRAYKHTTKQSAVGGTESVDGENYPSFPIVPLWGNPHRQSELIGIRESIDCYDLIKSGFANDLDDASMIYWTLENAGGMDDVDLARFVERMKTVKAAVVDGDAGAKAESHTIDVPYEAREAALDRLKTDLYEDFQIVNVHELTSGAKTATEIRAAYQPMDNKADEYEYCVLDFLQLLFAVIGIEDSPTFTRSRIVNQTEETQMVLAAANYLDDEAVLEHLPWLTQEEAAAILKRRDAEDAARLNKTDPDEDPDNEPEENPVEE
jgi:hypothetical protein